jgi:tRNA-dihydrouridine synthase
MLAPMEGVTDNAFRTLYYKNGADLTFTEMARVDNLANLKKSALQIPHQPKSSLLVQK